MINTSTPVNPKTANRVRDAIKELNYVPCPAARTLANRRTNTIRLLLPEISGVFFPLIQFGIEAGATVKVPAPLPEGWTQEPFQIKSLVDSYW